MQPQIFIAPNQPLVVMINTATATRLPSMCDRIARGLKNRGLSVQVFDTASLPDCKDFEFKYKQGLIKSQVVILQGLFYVIGCAKSVNKSSSFFNSKSVRPHLSFLLHYDNALHADWQKAAILNPDDFTALPIKAFGTDNHYPLEIEKDFDEVYACGRIVNVVLGCVGV